MSGQMPYFAPTSFSPTSKPATPNSAMLNSLRQLPGNEQDNLVPVHAYPVQPGPAADRSAFGASTPQTSATPSLSPQISGNPTSAGLVEHDDSSEQEPPRFNEGPHMSEPAMRAHLDSGRAQPLFPPSEVPTGPVSFAGQWWAILKSAPDQGYTLVDDPAMIGALNDTAARVGSGV